MALRAIYYDTETTGLKFDQDKIIELAAYDPVEDKTFNELINPGVPIPEESRKIHNISDEMVKDAPDFKTIAEKFNAFCSGDVVMIAHNNDAFDQPFLASEYQRANVEMPEWKYLDSLKWARRYRSDLPKHNLQFLREIYQIEKNQAHRALDDVIILHTVFNLMIDDLPLETALELLAKPKEITRMPFGKHQGKHLKDVPQDYVKWLHSSGAFDKNQDLLEAFTKIGFIPTEG